MSTTSVSSGPPEVYGGLGPLALGVTWMLASLATILFTLRVYVLIGMKRRLGMMQVVWTAVSWSTGLLGQIALTIAIRAYGIGNHLPILLETGTVGASVLWVWICQSFALVSIGSGKCAAVSSIIAVQGPTNPIAKTCLWILAGINVLMDGSVMIAVWFQCDPVQKLWETTLPGSCAGKAPVTNFAIAVGSVNSASDFIFALYPVWMLWHTQISKARKAGVTMLLGCVAFAGVCAAVKSSELYNIGATTDPTYEIMHLVIWAFTEQWMVIIAVIIPGLGPLLHNAIERMSSTFYSRRNKSYQNTGDSSHELRKYRGEIGSQNKRPTTFVRSQGFRQMPGEDDLVTLSPQEPRDGYIFMQRDMTVETEMGSRTGDEESMARIERAKLGL